MSSTTSPWETPLALEAMLGEVVNIRRASEQIRAQAQKLVRAVEIQYGAHGCQFVAMASNAYGGKAAINGCDACGTVALAVTDLAKALGVGVTIGRITVEPPPVKP